MHFSDLYGQLIQAWPETISLDDAQSPTKSGAQFFPTLAAINASIESRLNLADDSWAHLGHWALYQAFHQEAKACYYKGIRSLNTRAVPLALINEMVLKNLSSDGWELQRKTYRPYPA